MICQGANTYITITQISTEWSRYSIEKTLYQKKDVNEIITTRTLRRKSEIDDKSNWLTLSVTSARLPWNDEAFSMVTVVVETLDKPEDNGAALLDKATMAAAGVEVNWPAGVKVTAGEFKRLGVTEADGCEWCRNGVGLCAG